MAATDTARLAERPVESDSPVESPPLQNGHAAFPLYILLVLAIFFTLYAFAVFFLPVFMAFLFSLLLSPAVRALKRLRIPEPAGAAIILLAALGAVGFGAYQLIDPAREWMADVPQQITRT